MLNTSTLRPGLLVSMKTSIAGNVSYRKATIDPDHETAEGARQAKWETERTIADPAEYEEARKLRSKALSIVSGVCSWSAFGLLCPEQRTNDLDAAIAEARRLAEDFNGRAKISRIGIYVITGRIAPDDVEAVRAINSEIRSLLEDMQDGLKNMDVKGVRDAANRARGLGQMLSPAAAERISNAIEAARRSARKIVKAGETVSQAIDESTITYLEQARTSFLDLDVSPGVSTEDDTAADARAIDLAPEGETIAAPAEQVAAFEME